MTLQKRVSKLEQHSPVAVADGFQQLAPLISAFEPAQKALYDAWGPALETYIADQHPDLSYLFDELAAVERLPGNEQDKATAHMHACYADDIDRLNAIFYQQFQAARRGDIAPLVDCQEYHDFCDLIERCEIIANRFKAEHGQALASELGTRLKAHIAALQDEKGF